ncbi:MAG TPA: hypothetical protein VEO00_07000 [Actinomycetota bacterium]|nr:hypothetical protein [Actinomycetota bacterium]
MRRSFVVAAAILAALTLLATQALAADLTGTPGNDYLYGTNGNDNINGLAGHDWIWGNGGGDIIIGSYGNDKLIGNDGPDHLYGRSGGDTLWGEELGCGYWVGGLHATGGPVPCPSPDLDQFYGGTNDDVIHADDRAFQPGDPSLGEFIDCGGGYDIAFVDPSDWARALVGQINLLTTCESIFVSL